MSSTPPRPRCRRTSRGRSPRRRRGRSAVGGPGGSQGHTVSKRGQPVTPGDAASGTGWLDGRHGTPSTSTADAVALTEDLVDIESVSGNEQEIADAVEAALRGLDHLEVQRFGHTVVARTDLGRAERVVIAGHLDTVPLNDNLPARRDERRAARAGHLRHEGRRRGRAAARRDDAGDRTATSPTCSTSARRSRPSATASSCSPQSHPDLLAGRLRDPDGALRRRRRGRLPGHPARRRHARAASARTRPARGLGVNAIHGAGDVLARLNAYEPRRPVIDGLEYHEGLNAVFIAGGVAGNVHPRRVRGLGQLPLRPGPLGGGGLRARARGVRRLRVELSDSAPARVPGLSVPAAAAFIEAVGGTGDPKFGWTDVARFSGARASPR